MLKVFDKLDGKTTTDRYEDYVRFYQYIIHYYDNEDDILAVIMEKKGGDKSKNTKHIFAALRIHDFLERCPQGTITKIDKIPITYFRKIDYENWNIVRIKLGLPAHSSKDWREQIKIKE